MNSSAMNFNETKFSYLPFEMVEKILMYASEYTPALKMVCSLWRDIFGDRRKKVLTINEIIKKGHIHLLKWARINMINIYIHSRYAPFFEERNPLNVSEIIEEAFIAGHEKIYNAAIEPRDEESDDYDFMATLTSRHGYEYLCRLAIESGPFSAGKILEEATIAGHENICRLAIEWGEGEDLEVNYGYICSLASRNGHEHICRLYCEMWRPWCDGNSIIYGAALNGHENICRLAMEKGLTNAKLFILGARRGNNKKIIKLAREFKSSRCGAT